MIVIKEEAKDRLKSEAEGLKGFLSEKSQQVKHLVKQMGDRVRSLISPQDKVISSKKHTIDVGAQLRTLREARCAPTG